MSRKPAHILAASKKPTGRQAIWQEIRRQHDRFDVRSLATATDIHRKTISDYLVGLQAAGFIEIAESTPPALFRLAKDVGVEAPRVTRDGRPVTQGMPREQMWRTMKMLSDFTVAELAVSASTEAVSVSAVDAKDYCANLARAGYLVVLSKGKGLGIGGELSRFRFVKAKNTGPRPPMVQRMQTVFDPNLGQIVWHPEVDA